MWAPMLLTLVASTTAQSSIRFGPYYSLGATTSYIIEAQTTLYPGKTPNPQQNRMVLWPGMGTDKIPGTNAGALVQAIVSSSGSEAKGLCGASSGQWCVFASVLQNDLQISGSAVPMNADKGVTINYKYDETSQNITQTVSIDGKIVSTLSSKSGKAIGWGTAVECQDACSGIVNAHTYSNTTIRLAAADKAFGNTLAINEANATLLTATDSGKTWHVDTINIHQHKF